MSKDECINHRWRLDVDLEDWFCKDCGKRYVKREASG